MLAEEADGDELTEEARNAFYAAEGRWSARIRDLGPRRVEAMRVFRALRGESPGEVSRFVTELVPIIEEATLVEIECVVLALEGVGAEVLLSRLG
jgi:hypothetical protein